MEPFEPWLLSVAQAIEPGEVQAELLIYLQAELDAAREKPKTEGHAEAVRDIAEILGMPLDEAEKPGFIGSTAQRDTGAAHAPDRGGVDGGADEGVGS